MKEFLILGANTAFTYKDIFPSIFKGYCNCTKEHTRIFAGNDKPVAIRWYTSITLPEPPHVELTEKYTPEKYPKYDNYDAINVDKSKDIPGDYYGLMGVPQSFFSKLNRQQFDFIGLFGDFKENDPENGIICGEKTEAFERGGRNYGPALNKRKLFKRLIIKRKTDQQ